MKTATELLIEMNNQELEWQIAQGFTIRPKNVFLNDKIVTELAHLMQTESVL